MKGKIMTPINEIIHNTPKETILAALKLIEIDDGYGIFNPQVFLDLGIDSAIVAHVCHRHDSDYSSPKSTISNLEGYPLDAVTGIHGLELLQLIANAFEIHSPYMGRGRSARHYQAELKVKLNG
jgi:hypothetical protein